jgi:hypothetical protein
MTTTSLMWHHGRETASGSVAATVAMDRVTWEAAGASFTQVDDGDGERPWLAVGTVELEDEPAQFGVLDYGDESTHLIVGGPYDERPNLTARIVDDLLAAGAIPDESLVLEIIGLAKPASVDDKLDYLADIMETRLAETRSVFEELVRQLQQRLEQTLESAAAPSIVAAVEDAIPYTGPSILPSPLAGGVRDLVTLPGLAHIHGHVEQVNIRAPAFAFSKLADIMYAPHHGDPSAHVTHFDSATGEAVVTIEADDGRVLLVIAGLAQSLNSSDEISLFPLAPARSQHTSARAFEVKHYAAPAARSRRRRIRFRIF